MASSRKSAKPAKSAGIKVDFSDTETQTALPEGDYLLEVDEVEQKTSEKSGGDYLSLTFKVAEGPFAGKKVWHNCSLQPQALFNLRGVLEALGFEVPQGVMELDPADLVGETCGGTVQMEVYEGKNKLRVVEFFSAEDLEPEDGTPPPAPAKPVKAAAKKAAPEPEPEAPAASSKKKVVKKAAAPAEPGFSVGDKVSFTDDDGDELTGKITALDDEGGATVKVGKDEWDIPLEDLTKD